MTEVSNLPVITLGGRYLWRNGERFIVKGIVYQRSLRREPPSDPLADIHVETVRRDILVFQELGINAIFVYKINPDLQHDEVMRILASAGIYVLALASDHRNRAVISRTHPRQSYDGSTEVQSHFDAVATCMARYRNTLGILIASDLTNAYSGDQRLVQETCEVLTQATRELKRHMRIQHNENGLRILPVGIADTYWSLTNTATFDHLVATRSNLRGDNHNENENDLNSSLDFYCVNHYNNSAPGSLTQQTRIVARAGGQQDASDKPLVWNMIHTLPQLNQPDRQIPILLSEFSGNNATRPRTFEAISDLYSKNNTSKGSMTEIPPPMLDVLSGGFVYEYYEGSNMYGLVKVDEDSDTLVKLPDYYALKDRLDQLVLE